MSFEITKTAARLLSSLALWCIANIHLAVAEQFTANWPQFRGPNCSGVAEGARPPAKIGPAEKALWKVKVPWSPSSPCVWGNRIFLTTFHEEELQSRCYDAANGEMLWSKGVKPGRFEKFHPSDGSPAAATPATDGEHVVSYFGSFGLICYDFAGKELWRHPLPVALSGGSFGSGTSPIIVGKRILLNRDQDVNSSLLALDVATGETVWETRRPDATGSFGTPICWKNDGVEEVVLASSSRLKGYDVQSGEERWVVDKVPAFVCTTATTGDGWLFFAGWSPGKGDAPWPSWESNVAKHDKNKDGAITFDEFDVSDRDFARGMDVDHDDRITKADWDAILARIARSENVMLAVKPGGRGAISQTHTAWTFNRGLPYVSSPLFYDGRIYTVRDGGMISSVDAKSGKAFYTQERLGTMGSYYASPIAAQGLIYVASLPGKVTVIKAGGDKPEIVHQADFGERIFATPALVGDTLYLRTAGHLWAFRGKQSE